ncbi:MAG TPA: methyltransferase [Polyangiaceae bacterium]
MNLPTLTESVPAPTAPPDAGKLVSLAAELRRAGYDIATCAKKLGVFPRLGVNFWEAMRFKWAPQPTDPVDTLIGLFIDGKEVPVDRMTSLFSSGFIDAALESGLADREGGSVRSRVCLFPCYGKYLATDRAAKNTAINQVMWLWGESYILGGLVKRVPRRRAIDLGTGSGIHAILASDHAKNVVAVDVNPRALAFARFNAALNGNGNLEFVLSDLLERVDGTCDLLLANPPYAPDEAAAAGDNFWSGGIEGTDLLRRIIQALPTRLDEDGTAHIVALYPNPKGTTIKDHFDRWLDGNIAAWEVLDHTWPVPRYEDLFSEKPFGGDKSAWRFGVVSLRRASGRPGFWKEVAGKAVFFRADGSCSVVSDHDAAW